MTNEDNLINEVQKERARATQSVDILSTLLRMEGWLSFENTLKEQLKLAQVDWFQPSKDLSNVLHREFLSGLMYGLTTAIELPQQMLDEAQATLEIDREMKKAEERQRAEEEEMEDEDSTFEE